MNDNLLAIYNGLKVKNPHLPPPDVFAGDMADDAKRGILYNGLRTKNPGLPAFDIFSRDLGYGTDGGKPEASSQQLGERTSGKELPGWMLRDAEPEDGKTDKGEERRGFWDTQVKDVLERIGVENNDFSNMALKEKEKGYWDTYAGDSLERVGAGIYGPVGSTYSLMDKVYGLTLRPWARLVGLDDGSPTWMKRYAKQNRDYASTLRERADRYGGKSVADLWKEGNYASVIGDVFLNVSESLPLVLGSIYNPTVAAATGGALAGVDKYDELDEMPETRDMPVYQKIIDAVTTGAFEAITGILGDKGGKSIKKFYDEVGAEAAKGLLKDGCRKLLYLAYKKYGVLVEPVIGAIEDGVTQLAENVTDYFAGASDKLEPMKGVADALAYGFGNGTMGSVAQKAPGYADQVTKRIKESRERRKPLRGLPESDMRRFEEGTGKLSFLELVEGADSGLKLLPERGEAIPDFARKVNLYRDAEGPEAPKREGLYGLFTRMANRKTGEIVIGKDAGGNPVYVLDETGQRSLVKYNDGMEKFVPTAELKDVQRQRVEDHVNDYMFRPGEQPAGVEGTGIGNGEVSGGLGGMVHEGKAVDILDEGIDKDGTVLVKQGNGSVVRVVAKELQPLPGIIAGDTGLLPDTKAEPGEGAKMPEAERPDVAVGDRIKPAGRGVFGNVYDQFRGKAKEAVHFLSQQKGGVAAGALQHPEIGDIDLVWGNEKSGLMKMLKRYPEVLDNLQDEIDGMNVVMVSDNRIVLESPGRRAVISKKLGNTGTDRWLLSAYKKNRSAVPIGGGK